MLHGLTPTAYDADADRVQWCDLRGIAFEEPFFEQTLRRAVRERDRRRTVVWTPAEELQAVACSVSDGATLPLAGLILHTSRCGSTLVARMLAALSGAVVLSEPPVIDQVLRASSIGVSERARRLNWLLAALAQRRSAREAWLAIKLDAWHARDLVLLRRCLPGTPWAFVYRDPAEVVASQMHLPGMPAAPGMIPPELFGLELAAALALPREEYCARVFTTICEDALAQLSAGGLAVAYQDLPEAVAAEVVPHFGLTAGVGERVAMRDAARLDAKRPQQPFDAAASRRPVTPAVRRAVDGRARAAYERLLATRAGAPISHPVASGAGYAW